MPPLPAQKRDQPASPPKDLLEVDAASVENRFQGVGQVAATVSLDLVELAEKIRSRGNADHDDSTRADEAPETLHGGAVVVQVFDHVERQYGVERLEALV